MDMSPEGPFPDCHHLASWAAICPGNNESAGKRRSGKTRQGNRWLRGMLTQTAWAAAAAKNSLFRDRYQRIKLRRGGQRAVIAMAHAQLIAAYWALRNGSPHPEQVQRLEQDRRDPRRPQHAGTTRYSAIEWTGVKGCVTVLPYVDLLESRPRGRLPAGECV